MKVKESKCEMSMSRKDVFSLVALALIIALFFSFFFNYANAAPAGSTIIYNKTEQANATPAASITTAGGTFTTLVLNGSFQTPRWKAYVGNVTGILTLDDSVSKTIYDWDLVSISGEVYVSRNSSITWSSIGCAQNSSIASEQTFLNINSSGVDSINKTFNNTIHRSFYVGTTSIAQSSCRAIATYVNDTRTQLALNSTFQEVLLQDGNSNLVFATLLVDSVQGYNSLSYDFQLIIPEDETRVNPTPYYFFVEIS